MTFKKYILFACALLALIGCHNEMEDSAQLELSLCIPIPERVAPRQNRVMGDPGTTEHFELPKYAYFFIVKELNTGGWQLWKKEELVLSEYDWVRTSLRPSATDSIYKCTYPIRFILMGEHQKGNVYGICSNVKLTFNQDMEDMSSLEDVLNWKFATAPDSIQENLQNIYSTPYNYEVLGKYYSTFDCTSGHLSHINLMMYHVAAKVDIKWNVEDSVRINRTTPNEGVRLLYMDALNLYTDMAYCFKPMQNVKASALSSGRTVAMVRPEDEGLWWEGRSYFYTIPYTVNNCHPLQLKMQTSEGGPDYLPTINLGLSASDTIFVPWLRADFNITQQLSGTETKTISN